MAAGGLAAIQFLAAPLPLLICIALFLFGMLTAQVYSYWLTYNRDSKGFKALVGSLWTLEFIHSAMCMHMTYWYFITNLGNPPALLTIVWSISASIALEISVVALSQGFFIYRLWSFSGRKLSVVAGPAFLLFARIGLAVGMVYELAVIHTWQEFAETRSSNLLLNVGFSIGVAVDLILTTLMTYYLHKHKTSFKRTQHMVEQLTFYTINTGALTTSVSVVILMLYNLLPASLAFGGLIQCVSKLYANSVLAMLNARRHISEQAQSQGGINSIPLHLRDAASSRNKSHLRTDSDGVRVDIYKQSNADTSVGTYGSGGTASVTLNDPSSRLEKSYAIA